MADTAPAAPDPVAADPPASDALSFEDALKAMQAPPPAEAANDDEAADDAPPADPDAEPPLDPDAEPEAEAPPTDDDPEVEVEVGDAKERVKLSELRAGYLRQRDYTAKTMEAAEARKEADAAAEKAHALEEQYARMLPMLIQQLSADVEAEPDWERVAEEDPIGWTRQKLAWDRKVGLRQAAMAEQQRVASAELQTRLKGEAQKLIEKLPEAADAKTWPARAAELRAYLKTAVGASDAELNAIADHRLLVLAHKAERYDALMANKPKPDPAPVAQRPPASATAATQRVTPPKFREVAQARGTFTKAPSIDTAMDLLRAERGR